MKKILIIALLLIFLAGCSKPEVSNGTVPGTNKGVGFVPSSDFKQSLTDADSSGSYVGFYAPLDVNKDIPELVKVAYEYKMNSIPIVNINFFNAATGQKMPGYTEEMYKKQILNIVSKYKPRYIGIGNEINRYDYIDEFVPVYNDLYKEIKKISPETKVFTVFQYEDLNDLSIISKFDVDAVGITTYPFLKGYKSPKEIPSGYYSRLSGLSKPMMFTEIGWHSSASEDEQVEFLNIFYQETAKANIKPEITIWGLLYDVPSKGSMWNSGLFTKEGVKKKIFYEWTKG